MRLRSRAVWLALAAAAAGTRVAVEDVDIDGLPAVAARAARDAGYENTAETRRWSAQLLASRLNASDLSGDWDAVVRPLLLGACGLKDLRRHRPGEGFTGHCFADWNHVDCCAMALEAADAENGYRVAGIHAANALGDGIRAARVDALGSGGSWCTCAMGGATVPPGDVCHVQFNARPAFKLVWCEGPDGDPDAFVLADDWGNRLAGPAVPSGGPPLDHRKANAREFAGSRFGAACTARSAVGAI